jgi:Flp pilus assembly pilin Flp
MSPVRLTGTPPPEPFQEVKILTRITDLIARAKDEAGQTMAEYAVVLAVITIAVVVTLGLLSTAISKQLNSVVGIL